MSIVSIISKKRKKALIMLPLLHWSFFKCFFYLFLVFLQDFLKFFIEVLFQGLFSSDS